MTIEGLQQLCAELPSVTQEVKWEHDLCFCIGGNMFLVLPLERTPQHHSRLPTANLR